MEKRVQGHLQRANSSSTIVFQNIIEQKYKNLSYLCIEYAHFAFSQVGFQLNFFISFNMDAINI